MNNRGFFKVLGLTAAVLMVAAFALQATAAEADSRRHGIRWVWSQTSAAANRATSALAAGHAARAVRLAHTAMTSAPVPSDRLIAMHTLCLAHLAQGDIARADTHCRAALRTSDSTHVVMRRGALVAMAAPTHEDAPPEDAAPADAAHAFTLVAVIRANVSEAYGTAVAENFTSSVEAAAW